MTRLSTSLTCAVLSLGLVACGDKPGHEDAESRWIARTVAVRVLTTDLLRGGSAALYPDGRAIVSVMHLGGWTDWHGTWVEEGKRLTIQLPRQQEMFVDVYSAPKGLDPPDELVLIRTAEGGWNEERRTFVSFDDRRLPWSTEGTHRVPRVAVESDFHFLTKEEFMARGGWEPVPEAVDPDQVPEVPSTPQGKGK